MSRKMTPPPEREVIEREVAELFRNGDLTDIARFLQKDFSSISREFNPAEDTRNNRVFQIIIGLWAFDNIREELGDDILAIIVREREKWLPSFSKLQISPARLTGRVGKEFCEAVEAEIAALPFEKQIAEWSDVERAAREKKQAVIDERNAKYFGVDVRSIAKDAVTKRNGVKI